MKNKENYKLMDSSDFIPDPKLNYNPWFVAFDKSMNIIAVGNYEQAHNKAVIRGENTPRRINVRYLKLKVIKEHNKLLEEILSKN